MELCKGENLRAALPGNRVGAQELGFFGSRPDLGGGKSEFDKYTGESWGWAALASPTRQDQGDLSQGYPAPACFCCKGY